MTPEERIEAILNHPIATDEDYSALAELVEDESKEMEALTE